MLKVCTSARMQTVHVLPRQLCTKPTEDDVFSCLRRTCRYECSNEHAVRLRRERRLERAGAGPTWGASEVPQLLHLHSGPLVSDTPAKIGYGCGVLGLLWCSAASGPFYARVLRLKAFCQPAGQNILAELIPQPFQSKKELKPTSSMRAEHVCLAVHVAGQATGRPAAGHRRARRLFLWCLMRSIENKADGTKAIPIGM